MVLAVNDIKTVRDRLTSHAQTLGVFRQVYGAEPIANPALTEMTAAFWVDAIDPMPLSSGLAETAAVVTFFGRLYDSADREPRDAIDPAMSDAVVLLIAAYSGDFELGGTATSIDLLGRSGQRLGAKAGYVPYDESGATLRVFTITIPVIFASAWTQAP